MSTRRERITRKVRRCMGGVLDELPPEASIKSTLKIHGIVWAELTDGRIAPMPVPRGLVWTGKAFVTKEIT